MASNSIGNLFKLTTFGESHGKVIGGVVDGCPAGLKLDLKKIQKELDRRRPGQSKIVTTRNEGDKIEILSGMFDGITTGAPLAFIIANNNTRESDYDSFKDLYRPSHADYTYLTKYGIRDPFGGGRASARETAARVAGGAIAKQLTSASKIEIVAYVSAIGNIWLPEIQFDVKETTVEKNIVRCPNESIAKKMISLVEKTRKDGDTVGGQITCIIRNVPVGLGEPVFDKLQADLAKAMMGIHATKGFEYGTGFKAIRMNGSTHNDIFIPNHKKGVKTKTNNSGGIQGGISNGEDIYFNVAFKPVSTIMQTQKTVNSKGEVIKFTGKGRHDPCVVPRAVPIVEAMAALVLADHLLRSKSSKL